MDEAGRGPWAGPVVAAAAWLDPISISGDLLASLDDSKKLTAKRRAETFELLRAHPAVSLGLGEATVAEIDRLNILQAALLAMSRAVAALPITTDKALIDGNKLPQLPIPAEAIVKGDGASYSIAAASIVAKVTRDRLMAGLAEDHPGYGWERNQGYGTAEHQETLRRLGVTPHHRRSFRPIRALMEVQKQAFGNLS